MPGKTASHVPPYVAMRERMRMPCGWKPKTYCFAGSKASSRVIVTLETQQQSGQFRSVPSDPLLERGERE